MCSTFSTSSRSQNGHMSVLPSGKTSLILRANLDVFLSISESKNSLCLQINWPRIVFPALPFRRNGVSPEVNSARTAASVGRVRAESLDTWYWYQLFSILLDDVLCVYVPCMCVRCAHPRVWIPQNIASLFLSIERASDFGPESGCLTNLGKVRT